MSKLLILALCLSLVAMGLACANAPQASIDEAKNALEAAREAGAEEYAPEAWQGAQDALTSAMTEVEAQNERFALLRSYDAAEQLLEEAQQAANTAATEAAEARERARLEAEGLIQEAQTALTAATTAVDTAPKGKGTAANWAATHRLPGRRHPHAHPLSRYAKTTAVTYTAAMAPVSHATANRFVSTR